MNIHIQRFLHGSERTGANLLSGRVDADGAINLVTALSADEPDGFSFDMSKPQGLTIRANVAKDGNSVTVRVFQFGELLFMRRAFDRNYRMVSGRPAKGIN